MKRSFIFGLILIFSTFLSSANAQIPDPGVPDDSPIFDDNSCSCDYGPQFPEFCTRYDQLKDDVCYEEKTLHYCYWALGGCASGSHECYIEISCTDCNGDGHTDISDAVYLLNILFNSNYSTTPPTCDCNKDGVTNLSDAICILDYLF